MCNVVYLIQCTDYSGREWEDVRQVIIAPFQPVQAADLRISLQRGWLFL